MGQVFISYRHVAPDEDLAQALAARLGERGQPYFIDRRMQVGTRWVEEIERQVLASEIFLVLLSKDSIRSDMVRREVELAVKLEKEGKMRILPARVGFDGELPYDLAAWLNPFQYARWQPGEPMDGILGELLAAIEGRAALPLARSETDLDVLRLESGEEAPDAGPAPLPAAETRLDGDRDGAPEIAVLRRARGGSQDGARSLGGGGDAGRQRSAAER